MLNRLENVFKSLENHEVRYVVIGGIAAVLYGVPRATFDLDILIQASQGNGQKLLDAFIDVGLGSASQITTEKLLENEITIFEDRVRIDVQTVTPGVIFKQAWKNKQIMHYQEQAFFVISKKDLIASKRASGREIDIKDVRLLEQGNND
jgi:hypothetical protein